VPGQPRETGPEDGDHLSAVEAGVLDLQPERPRDQAADVKEAQAALVLLVGVGGLVTTRGLSRTIGSASGSGGATTTAARSVPICGAARPMPLPNTWCSRTRCMAANSRSMTSQVSSASAGRAKGRAVSDRTGSPSCTMPAAFIRSLAFESIGYVIADYAAGPRWPSRMVWVIGGRSQRARSSLAMATIGSGCRVPCTSMAAAERLRGDGPGIQQDAPLLQPELEELQAGELGDLQRVGERAGVGGEGP
jgi:hypothetical protein